MRRPTRRSSALIILISLVLLYGIFWLTFHHTFWIGFGGDEADHGATDGSHPEKGGGALKSRRRTDLEVAHVSENHGNVAADENDEEHPAGKKKGGKKHPGGKKGGKGHKPGKSPGANKDGGKKSSDAEKHSAGTKRTKKPKKSLAVPGGYKVSTDSGGDINAQVYAAGQPPDYAYLMIISNEDFMDGAMVLGTSLRDHSKLLQSGDAHLVIMVAKGRLGEDSKLRLGLIGFNRIVEVNSLAPRAPGAYWKDTYDKLYMFNLTAYKKVVFMDADMLTVRSPDDLFTTNYGTPEFVGAIGSHGGTNTYFQTGMMVIQPTTKLFDKIMREFESGVPPLGKHYNQGMNGRDGVLLRNVFKSDFKSIDNKYSRNLNPRFKIPTSVRSLHFRGKHKPWFNKLLPNADPQLGKKEFGYGYIEWWKIYDRLHRESPEYQLAVARRDHEGKSTEVIHNASGLSPELLEFAERTLLHYGGNSTLPPSPPGGQGEDVGALRFGYQGSGRLEPLTHVWMMRYTKREYVQLSDDADAEARNVTFPDALNFVVSSAGDSCDQACEKESGKCVEKFLYHSKLQDCNFLTEHLKCDSCEPGVYWREHPGNDHPSREEEGKVVKNTKHVCFYNYLHDDRSLPKCDAFNTTTTRLCPCLHAA